MAGFDMNDDNIFGNMIQDSINKMANREQQLAEEYKEKAKTMLKKEKLLAEITKLELSNTTLTFAELKTLIRNVLEEE